MNSERVFSLRNPWFLGAAGTTAIIAVLAGWVGFIWLPLQVDGRLGLWDAICSAAGLIRAAPPSAPVQAAYKTTKVVLAARMPTGTDALSIGRGATLAMQCTMCHGARGVSEADTPNLAGQPAAVVFKELQDYRSGARVNAIMGPRVRDLTDQDVRDLAAYYAYLPPVRPATSGPIPPIVASGAPMRNIPPCGSCHGDRAYKAGSPWLEGASPVYLRAQLMAFASGERHNDIDEQMRNVARGMTREEIDAAAQYYGGRQGDSRGVP